MPIRTELAVIGVPRDSPDDVEYDDVLRAEDGRTHAVTYEAAIDAGDYEIGPGPDHHGIRLADRVIVVGDYIGESTRAEIAYAQELGKPLQFTHPEIDPDGGP